MMYAGQRYYDLITPSYYMDKSLSRLYFAFAFKNISLYYYAIWATWASHATYWWCLPLFIIISTLINLSECVAAVEFNKSFIVYYI